MGMEDTILHAFWDIGGDNVCKRLAYNDFYLIVSQFLEQLSHIVPILRGDGLSK